MRRLFAIANSVFALLGWRSAGNEEAVAHQLLWLLFNVGWRFWSLNIGKCTLAHAMVLLQIVFGGFGTVTRNVAIFVVLPILGSFQLLLLFQARLFQLLARLKWEEEHQWLVCWLE